MKAEKMLCVLLTLLVMLMFGGCATAKYVPKPNEEINGTWINEKISPQKNVNTPDGWKQYLPVSDSVPFYEGTGEIISKWTDSEGNIWYKSLITITGGTGDGDATKIILAELDKLSKSATVWESVWTMPTNEQELKTPIYPTTIDPKNPNYGIYYRAGD